LKSPLNNINIITSMDTVDRDNQNDEGHLPLFLYILAGVIPLMSLFLVINLLRKGYERYRTRIKTLLLIAVVEPLVLLIIILMLINYI